MSAAALSALVVTAAAGMLAWVAPAPGRAARLARAGAAPVALGVAAILALATSGDDLAPLGITAATLAAAAGGGPLTVEVLRLVPAAADAGADALRGGAAIGVLERLAIAATLLAGLPEGVAVVLAVKGLGRYPELRSPGTSERFIVGTLASVLWAAACAGTAVLALD